MKAFEKHSRFIILGAIGIFIITLLSGCGGDPATAPTATAVSVQPQPTATSIPPKATTLPPTATAAPSSETSTAIPTSTSVSEPTSVGSIAEEIAADVGQVMTVSEDDAQKTIFIFEETHGSPAGQVEIAIMLNRLYEDYALRTIGLEGAFDVDGKLDGTWLQAESPFQVRNPIRSREDVIVQLLQDGEISSAEALALIYDEAEVIGIEDAGEYAITMAEGASSAPTIYLYLTALPGMTDSEINEVNSLIEEDKIFEAIELIISTDPFTDEMYGRINDDSTIISAEEWLEILDEIEAQAASAGAEIDPEDKANMDQLREFFATASQRSDTMVTAVLKLAEAHPETPIAMIIGAAHTEHVVELFADANVSYAVLRANSLAEGHEEGDLSYEAYDRKELNLSVDPPGSLGALLDGRRKPQPVMQQLWFQVKSKTYYSVALAARAIAEGHTMDELANILPEFDNVKLLPLRMDGDELVFAIETVNNNGNPITLYGRALTNKLATDKLLDERLDEALENVQDKESPDPDVTEPTEVSEPTVTPISSDTIAIFSSDRNAIESSRLSG